MQACGLLQKHQIITGAHYHIQQLLLDNHDSHQDQIRDIPLQIWINLNDIHEKLL